MPPKIAFIIAQVILIPGRMSISADWMASKTSSAMPLPSTLMRCGWKRASEASNRSPPTLIYLINKLIYLTSINYNSNLDDAAVGQGVRLDEERGLLGELLLRHDVVADVAELLLHHADRLKVGGVVERVTPK